METIQAGLADGRMERDEREKISIITIIIINIDLIGSEDLQHKQWSNMLLQMCFDGGYVISLKCDPLSLTRGRLMNIALPFCQGHFHGSSRQLEYAVWSIEMNMTHPQD